VGGRIFFLADSLPGQGLFVSDGTTTGTRRLLDLCSSPCRFSNLRPEGGEVYFYGHDPARGATLWASDGTATGTRLLIDFGHAEPFGSSYLPPSPSLAVLGSRVVTVGFEPQSGLEPWALDRHGGGGQLLADIARGGEPGSFPEDAVALGDRLLFKAWDGEKKAAIWATLESAATTVKLADFPSSLLSLYDPPPSIALVGDRAFLNLGDLWVTDGTPGGTVRLTELGAATGGLRVTSAIVNCSGQAVFAVSDPQHTQLWSSDGTPEGTLAHGLILPFAVFELTAVGEDLYFWGNDGGPSRWEIWKTDCALTKLRRLTNLDDFLGTPPPGFARSGAFAYFLLPEPSGGSALWRSDGTRKGTVKVPSPEMDGVAQRPKAYVPREDGTLLLFTEGDRLRFWTTDGTAAGTALVRELDPGSTLQEVVPGGAGSVEFLVWNFYANPSGFRLYRTDGTPQGTHGLIDFAALGLAYVANVTRAGGHLFFAAGSAWDDTELWESDGTQETTRRFQEIAPGSQSSSPRPLAVAGSRLYLSAGDGLHGRELWSLPLDDLGGPCRPSASALCLGQGRFRAELFFHDRGNRRGDAYAVPWSSSSGAFWFYDYGNPEAVVKLADGPSGLFFGPLTDAYLSLTVTDVTTGEVRRYPGETGPLPAFADLSPPPAALGSAGDEKLTSAAQAVPSSCVPTPTRLCLYEGRFELELTGVEKPAHVFAHGERAGYFTFGGGNDVEAAFKLLDGRGQNGRFWLFAAMLTDLPAMLTVTDTTDGTVHVFTKPPGPPASFIDLSSLP
jgi:ELWxxDGT repeat protein